jgi:hypothetical protein
VELPEGPTEERLTRGWGALRHGSEAGAARTRPERSIAVRGLVSSLARRRAMQALFDQGNLRICGAGCFLAAALLLLLIHPLPARGQEYRSDALSALRHETLKEDNTTDHHCFVQRYAAELQQRSMESERRHTPAQIQEVVQLFERYTVFLVLDAKRGGLMLEKVVRSTPRRRG